MNTTNTTKRVDPLGLVALAGAGSQPRQETARMTNINLGKCPICQIDMPVVQAGEINAYVCTEHCVCLPTKDN